MVSVKREEKVLYLYIICPEFDFYPEVLA